MVISRLVISRLTVLKLSGTTTDHHFCWRLVRLTEILKIVYKLTKHYPDVFEVEFP